MMQLFYQLSLLIYSFLIQLFAPFHKKAKLLQKGHQNLFPRLQKAFENNQEQIAWFHTASLGEFEQARPVIEKYKIAYPSHKILLTFFSPSGYEIRKNYDQADWIFYLPQDGKTNARKFLKIVKPNIAFFVKYEFWHFYIQECKNRNIPLISFSTIFRENQLYFKNDFYKNILKNVHYFFVQNEQSSNLLTSINVSNQEIIGDTRFDRVFEICQNKKEFPIVKAFTENKPCLIIGSAWQEDIDVIAHFFNNFTNDLKLIIASHEIDKTTILKMKKCFTKEGINYSEANTENVKNKSILFIDNIGMLSSLYQYAQFVHIGGAFGKGLHNTLEAATYGVPIFFGPNYQKFQEAIDLVNLGGGFSIQNTQEFTEKFTELYTDKSEHKTVCQITEKYVQQNLGASQKIIDFCKNKVS